MHPICKNKTKNQTITRNTISLISVSQNLTEIFSFSFFFTFFWPLLWSRLKNFHEIFTLFIVKRILHRKNYLNIFQNVGTIFSAYFGPKFLRLLLYMHKEIDQQLLLQVILKQPNNLISLHAKTIFTFDITLSLI